MKLLIVTSPTGGHFYPAIEVCKKMLSCCDQIIFVIQKDNKFINIIKTLLGSSNKIVIEQISASKLSRKNPFSMIKLLFSMVLSITKSLMIISRHKPDIIFSTGGYTAVPIIIAAKMSCPFVPVILHEQNCVFSLTTKFLSIFATKVCLGFDIRKNKKFVFTGNPVRQKFFDRVDKEQVYQKLGFEKQKLTLLIFGGSQGAKSINTAIVNFINSNISRIKNLQFIHITGVLDFERINNEYKKVKDISYKIFPYVETMEELYSIADLVISRAGAMTISELIIFKIPAILIPLPTAAELHQHHNAYFLQKYGCAKIVFQNKHWEQSLSQTILQFVTTPVLLDDMKRNYNKIPQPKENIETVIKKIYIPSYARRKYCTV